MRVFLTGASGFLGRHVLRYLAADEVLCLVRNPWIGSWGQNVHPLRGELQWPEAWKNEVKEFAPQSCIHLAWIGLPDYSLTTCRKNLEAGINLFEVCADVGVERIVMAGSCWEYGVHAKGPIKEDGAIGSDSVFAATKHALRFMVERAANDAGMVFCWARIFFVYGPGQRASSLIPQCHAAYSKGAAPQIRDPGLAQDFVYVDDAAQAIVALARRQIGSGIFNVGSGMPTTVSYVVNRVASHFGRVPAFPLPRLESGFWANVSKLAAASEWMPRTGIDDGIARTLRALDLQE